MTSFFQLRRGLMALTLATLAVVPALAAEPAKPIKPLTIGLIPAEDSQAMIESSRLVLDSLQDEREIVWSSNPIPESPMVWRKDLDPALKAKIAQALADVKGLPWGDLAVAPGPRPRRTPAPGSAR
jgi:ABC-type phosphate/phosphonate transport system substrate-binding protein